MWKPEGTWPSLCHLMKTIILWKLECHLSIIKMKWHSLMTLHKSHPTHPSKAHTCKHRGSMMEKYPVPLQVWNRVIMRFCNGQDICLIHHACFLEFHNNNYCLNINIYSLYINILNNSFFVVACSLKKVLSIILTLIILFWSTCLLEGANIKGISGWYIINTVSSKMIFGSSQEILPVSTYPHSAVLHSH